MTLKLTKNEKRWGWFFLLAQMLVVPFAAALICLWMDVYSDTVVNNLCFFLNAALAVLIFRHLLEQSFRRCRGRWKQTVLTVLKGLGLYFLLNYAVNSLVFRIYPNFSNVNDATVGAMLTESPWLMTIAVVFAAPLAEECLCRGWMFTGLAEKSIPLAYCVTCGFFAAVHVLSYIGFYSPMTLALCFVQYLGPGIALCWACQRDDSLCAPLLMHMSINALACLMM